MDRSKMTFADWQTPEQRAWSAKDARRRAETQREINRMMGFWSICEKPKCRRAHACSGDLHACFARRWPRVPEAEKEYIRAAIKAAEHTKSAADIHSAGIAARDACLDRMRRIEPPQITMPPDGEAAAGDGPRIGRL